MLASMRMTTGTYQAVLLEMHAATASASLYPITTYRAAKGQKAGKKMKKKDLKADGRRPARASDWAHRAASGPNRQAVWTRSRSSK